MDKKTSLVCDFAEKLVVTTSTIQQQTTKVCALQEIALDYGWQVIEDMETHRSYLNHKKTLQWMRHEIHAQMKISYGDTTILNEPQQPTAHSKCTINGCCMIPF